VILLLVLQILFWLSVLAILHSYVFFPVILKMFAKDSLKNTIIYSKTDNLPEVSVVLAAHNEESVIAQKIESIFSSDYPNNKINLFVGTDCCSDKTDEIIQNYSQGNSRIFHFPFTERMGKAKIINSLSEKATGEVLILTDANVFFTKDTIYTMVRHFKNEKIGIVGSLIVNTNIKKNGISIQEKTYLESENTIKYREGILWGSMIGAFGGCYGIRKKAYTPVPLNYFMDDFYITMSALKNGYKAINELDSICEEDISNLIKEEFRRKVRISIGNFQNLKTFWKMMFPLFKGISFSFISHKILRWLTPFFIVISLTTSAILSWQGIQLYLLLLIIGLGSMFLPLVDFVLRKLNIHIVILRFITHFYSMNTALFIGFFKYLSGVDSNVWQPTKRNQ